MSIDFEGAMQRLGNDLSLYQEFIGYCEEDCPKRMAEIISAVEAGNAPALLHAAHGLKGLMASLGAKDVVVHASALERMGRADDLETAPETLAKLQADIDQLPRELEPYRNASALEFSGKQKE